MVTYSLRRVCGGRTATLVPQTVRRPYGFYINRTATSRFLARRKVIASLAFYFNLTLNFFSETAMPQPHRKITVRWPYGRLAMAVRAGIRFLPCLGCLENRTAASRRPHGGLTAPLRRQRGKLVAAATTVRSPCGHLPVSLQSPYGFWFHESNDRGGVAVTFATTTTVARKTLRF